MRVVEESEGAVAVPRDLERPMLARWRRGRADMPVVIFVPGFLTDHGLVGPSPTNGLEGWRTVLRAAFAERDVSIFALHWPAFRTQDLLRLEDVDDDARERWRSRTTLAAAAGLPAAGALTFGLRALVPGLARSVPLGGATLLGLNLLMAAGPLALGAYTAGRARRRWRRAIKRADAIARKLAALPDRTRQDVVLIGHSLGGRMVLQAAARRAGRARRFAAVLAMAAAARPTELPLDRASLGAVRAPEIAFSRNDWALANLYKAIERSWTDALGRVGPPPWPPHGCQGVDVSELDGLPLQHLAYERHLERVLRRTAMFGDRSLWG